ncbi:MAG: hypothetical protein QM831_17690 [Kofleriaceae bacterium]
MRGVVLLVVALVGCASSTQDECEMPSNVSYDCPDAAAAQCSGGPRWANGIDQPTAGFAVGCTATVPECSSLLPGTTRAFVCEVGPDGKPDWFEPL